MGRLRADFSTDVLIAQLELYRNGRVKFRRFLRGERGLGEESHLTPVEPEKAAADLPARLVSELARHQHLQQRNWRPASHDRDIRNCWNKHLIAWRFLCHERGVKQLADLKRQHLLDYVDLRLGSGRSVKTVNSEMRMLHTFLLFLQDEGYSVPQSLLRMQGLKEPDSLPKYLTDEQVKTLRDDFEDRVVQGRASHQRRYAVMDRAASYLLCQGGMRLAEVEELRLEDLDFPGKRLSVRNDKGLKDRTVYLTESVIAALQAYLARRGDGSTDHVFLYRNYPLKKDLISARMRDGDKRIGVKVYAHRLRHTCATQLLNAGCRITSIQRFLGHKKLNTTMIYTCTHRRCGVPAPTTRLWPRTRSLRCKAWSGGWGLVPNHNRAGPQSSMSRSLPYFTVGIFHFSVFSDRHHQSSRTGVPHDTPQCSTGG